MYFCNIELSWCAWFPNFLVYRIKTRLVHFTIKFQFKEALLRKLVHDTISKKNLTKDREPYSRGCCHDNAQY